MGIGERLKDLRHALGLTQEQFAARVGLSKATLVGYEVGQRKPGADALAAISRSGVNMTWLLTGDGEMFARRPSRATVGDAPPAQASRLLPSSHPRARRWDHLIRLVEQIEDEQQRDSVLSELFARAQDAAQIDELQRAVRELRAARGR
jgi:transcriptional regulator with XRE-family HTH domain